MEATTAASSVASACMLSMPLSNFSKPRILVAVRARVAARGEAREAPSQLPALSPCSRLAGALGARAGLWPAQSCHRPGKEEHLASAGLEGSSAAALMRALWLAEQ